MSRHLTINGTVVSGGRNSNGQAKPPGWALNAFRSYQPVYQYSLPYRVPLERVRYWPETGEWVGVYCAHVYSTPHRKYLPERFIIGFRNGSFPELKAFLAPGVYNRQRLG